MSGADLMGWMAAGATLLTFYSTDMTRLRALALVANVCFIAFAWSQSIWPVLALHALLLPLNVQRLVQARRAGSLGLAPISRWPGGTTSSTASAGVGRLR